MARFGLAGFCGGELGIRIWWVEMEWLWCGSVLCGASCKVMDLWCGGGPREMKIITQDLLAWS